MRICRHKGAVLVFFCVCVTVIIYKKELFVNYITLYGWNREQNTTVNFNRPYPNQLPQNNIKEVARNTIVTIKQSVGYKISKKKGYPHHSRDNDTKNQWIKGLDTPFEHEILYRKIKKIANSTKTRHQLLNVSVIQRKFEGMGLLDYIKTKAVFGVSFI